MKANVNAGEIGIDYEGRYYLFRPSFFALSQMGDEFEIVRKFNNLHFGGFNELIDAMSIISACYTGIDKADTDVLTGYFPLIDGEKIRYRPGGMSPNDIYVIAMELMKNGMVGNPEHQSSGEEADSFSPVEFVGAAVAHLGIEPSEAWNMTMIEFQQCIYAKYPEMKNRKDEHPSKEEYNALMKAHDEIIKKLEVSDGR